MDSSTKDRYADLGIEDRAFDQVAIAEFICSICLHLVDQPRQCNSGHTICFKCFQALVHHSQSKVECPTCRISMDRANPARNLVLESFLSRIDVYCKYRFTKNRHGRYIMDETGCEEHAPISEISRHEEVCKKAPALCLHCKEYEEAKSRRASNRSKKNYKITPESSTKDEVQIKRNLRVENLKEHVSHCPFRPASCSYCNKKMLFKDLYYHQEIFCEKIPVECEHCKESVEKWELKNHLDFHCTALRHICPFSKYFERIDTTSNNEENFEYDDYLDYEEEIKYGKVERFGDSVGKTRIWRDEPCFSKMDRLELQQHLISHASIHFLAVEQFNERQSLTVAARYERLLARKDVEFEELRRNLHSRNTITIDWIFPVDPSSFIPPTPSTPQQEGFVSKISSLFAAARTPSSPSSISFPVYTSKEFEIYGYRMHLVLWPLGENPIATQPATAAPPPQPFEPPKPLRRHHSTPVTPARPNVGFAAILTQSNMRTIDAISAQTEAASDTSSRATSETTDIPQSKRGLPSSDESSSTRIQSYCSLFLFVEKKEIPALKKSDYFSTESPSSRSRSSSISSNPSSSFSLAATTVEDTSRFRKGSSPPSSKPIPIHNLYSPNYEHGTTNLSRFDLYGGSRTVDPTDSSVIDNGSPQQHITAPGNPVCIDFNCPSSLSFEYTLRIVHNTPSLSRTDGGPFEVTLPLQSSVGIGDPKFIASSLLSSHSHGFLSRNNNLHIQCDIQIKRCTFEV